MQKSVAGWKARFQGQDNLGQFLRGSGGSLLVRMLSSGLGLGATIVLTNLLGTDYGKYALALSWLTALVLLGRLGFNKSATRYIAAYAGQKDWGLLKGFLQYSVKTTYKTSVVIALVTTGILLLARDFITGYYQDDGFYNCLLIAMGALPFLAHLELAEGTLDGFKRVVLSQLPMRSFRPALIALVMLGLFYWTAIGQFSYIIEGETTRALTAETAMIVNLIAIISALLLALGFTRHAIPGMVKDATPDYRNKEWFSTSRDMMFTSGFNLILVQADVMMLGALIDEDAAGLYTVASRMGLLLILALNSVNAILQPIASDLFASKKIAELQRIVSLGANGVFAISLLGGVVLYFGADYLHLIFGPEFRDTTELLRILIIGQLINAFAGPAVLLLNMTGHQRDAARVMAGGAILNVVLNGLFITWMGTPGAAIATATTTVIWNLVAAYMVWNRLQIVCIAFWQFKTKPSS